jgi:putative PIN family toxin of toxin-antitoxin system
VRLVLDTNTVVSGLLWSNAPSKLLDLALEGEVELFTSEWLLLELADVLSRPKFTERVAASGFTVEELTARYGVLAKSVTPAIISPVSADPEDDHVLACALAANVDIIVSRAKDLLNLKRYHSIDIVSAAEALLRIDRR